MAGKTNGKQKRARERERERVRELEREAYSDKNIWRNKDRVRITSSLHAWLHVQKVCELSWLEHKASKTLSKAARP